VSLTGTKFQWLTIIAAIVVTIAVIAGWNRVRGPRPVKLASRIALLTAGYSMTAVAILVSINITYGGLIATWGDLFANLNPAPSNWHPHYRGHRHGSHADPPAIFGGPHQLPPPHGATARTPPRQPSPTPLPLRPGTPE
jgi:hypothetical protein